MTATATAPQQTTGWGQTAEKAFENNGFGGAGEFDFDTDGVDTTKVSNETTFLVDKPGKYHMTVQATEHFETVNKDNGEQLSPHVNLALTVVHSVEGQSPEGAVLFVRLTVAGKGGGQREDWQVAQTLNLLKGLGLVVEQGGKLIDPSNGTTKLDWKTWASRAHGMQVVADVKMSKPDANRLDPRTQQPYPARAELPFGRGLYQVNDPKVKDVPKSAAALALIGMTAAAPADTKAETKATTSRASTPAANAPPAPSPAPAVAQAPAAPVAPATAPGPLPGADLDDLDI